MSGQDNSKQMHSMGHCGQFSPDDRFSFGTHPRTTRPAGSAGDFLQHSFLVLKKYVGIECWRNCHRFLDRENLGIVLSCTRGTCLTNAIPLENNGRSETMSAGSSCSNGNRFMEGTAKTRNLERILKEDGGTSALPEHVEKFRKPGQSCRKLGKPEILLRTCLQYA